MDGLLSEVHLCTAALCQGPNVILVCCWSRRFDELYQRWTKENTRSMHRVHKKGAVATPNRRRWSWVICVSGYLQTPPPALFQIVLPSARHLEEGRGTTILELPRLENYIKQVVP